MYKKVYKVSIIIPVYNMEKYLRDCLESVLKQEMEEIEVICVNDGSTDNSSVILEEYKSKISNFIIVTQTNQGLSCARNAGLNIARGEYIYFLDSDDEIVPKAMYSLYNYAKKNQTDIVLFDGDVVYASDELQRLSTIDKHIYQRKSRYEGVKEGLTMMQELVKNDDYKVSSCLQFFRKDFLRQWNIRFEPGILHEDNLFSFQCMFFAKRVTYLKKSFFIRRVREGSIMMQKRTWKHFWGQFYSYTQMRLIIDKYAKDMSEEGVFATTYIADKLLKNARWTYFNQLSKVEKAKVKELSTYDYWIVKNMVLEWAELICSKDEEFPFPFYLLKPESKILLYGAGTIGCRYYEQIISSGYVDVVKWVDRNYEVIRNERFPVCDVCFDDCEYDYIFLAIANQEVALSIIKDIIERGISEEKIIWVGTEYVKKSKEQMRLIYKKIMDKEAVALQGVSTVAQSPVLKKNTDIPR